MLHTLGQVAYEAAATASGCDQPWIEANQQKWEAAAAAVYDVLSGSLPAGRGPGHVCSMCGEYVPLGWLHGCA